MDCNGDVGDVESTDKEAKITSKLLCYRSISWRQREDRVGESVGRPIKVLGPPPCCLRPLMTQCITTEVQYQTIVIMSIAATLY